MPKYAPGQWTQRREPVTLSRNRLGSHPPHGDSQLQAKTPSPAVPLPTVTVHCFGVAVMLALLTVAVNDAADPAIDVVLPTLGLKIVDDSAAV